MSEEPVNRLELPTRISDMKVRGSYGICQQRMSILHSCIENANDGCAVRSRAKALTKLINPLSLL